MITIVDQSCNLNFGEKLFGKIVKYSDIFSISRHHMVL
jgi:hypothetical protein